MDKTKFDNMYYYPTLKRKLYFEIKSFIGRLFSKSIIKTKKKYLELGCGKFKNNNNFIYLDFYDFNLRKNFSFKTKKNIIGHDLRYKLPFEANTFKGVFMEHALEHLHPVDAINLISEIRRVLIPGGIVRITVPDLDIYVREYNKKNKSKKFSKFLNNCEIIWNLTQNYLHLSVWNYEMLRFQLKNVGFFKIKKQSFLNGKNKNLLLDRQDRKFETLYIEAEK
jgi:predicted SAM-dependent methyltransferase